MHFFKLALFISAPLAAHALPKRHTCGHKPKHSAVHHQPSGPAEVPTLVTVPTPSSTSAPAEVSVVTPTTVSVVPSSSSSDEAPAVETTSVVVAPAPSSSTETPIEVLPSVIAVPEPATTSQEATATLNNALSQASAVGNEAQTDHCEDDGRRILPGRPWTVANSMYNADQMVGTQCTNFDAILEAADGTLEVQWTSITNIDLVDATKDVCKGYSNVGIGKNLRQPLNQIASIPAYYKWERTNTTEFRGSNIFDFITAPTAGDGSSTATSEFMLWIQNWGNQVPIGFSQGPVANLTLFGATWKLYEGQNPDSGVTVRSMLADADFPGEFQGDLKEWLEVMVGRGYIADTDFVNVGNAGSEVFYGDATMQATVALDIVLRQSKNGASSSAVSTRPRTPARRSLQSRVGGGAHRVLLELCSGYRALCMSFASILYTYIL